MCGRGGTFVAHMEVLRQVCDVWEGGHIRGTHGGAEAGV